MNFPFERDKYYSFALLRAFRSELLFCRKNDPEFSGKLRCNDLPWAKVYNKEIVPIALLDEKKKFKEKETFKLMPEGHAADIALGLNTGDIACQITLANPIWDDEKAKLGSSYIHNLQMEYLNKEGAVFGGGKSYNTNLH